MKTSFDFESARESALKNGRAAFLRFGQDALFSSALQAVGLTTLDSTYITTALLLTINIGRAIDNNITAERIERIVRNFYYDKAEIAITTSD